MPAVNNVLVVGGGLAGAATAIHLADAGVAVDLIEIKPDVAALGSGITLQGNALRELRGARRLGPGAGGRLRLRRHRHPRTGPGGHRASPRSPTPRPAARTCPPHGHAPPELARILARPGDRGRREGAASAPRSPT